MKQFNKMIGCVNIYENIRLINTGYLVPLPVYAFVCVCACVPVLPASVFYIIIKQFKTITI